MNNKLLEIKLLEILNLVRWEGAMISDAGLVQAPPPKGTRKKQKACDIKFLVERRLARIKK